MQKTQFKTPILLVSSEFPPGPGGIGTHCYQLARELTTLGWEVTVLTAQDYAEDEEIGSFNNTQEFKIVRFKRVPFALAEAWHRLRTIAESIRKEKPEILVATGSRSVWIVRLIAKWYRVPWVAIGHGSEFGFTNWQKKLTRSCFQAATAVICVSQYTWKRMLKANIRPKSGLVIENGADSEQFYPISREEMEQFRSKLQIKDARFLLTVGNVTERKGQDIVVRALPLILKQVPDIHYFIVGLPTRKNELINIANELGVSDRVHFTGRANHEMLLRFLNCCELFVLTSRNTSDGDFEGYGIVVVEAALCGKPSVVSDNSGLMEAIAQGETGEIVPENNVAATADKIVALLTDESQLRRMGAAARKRATEQQTWNIRAKEYDLFLRGLVQPASSLDSQVFKLPERKKA